MGNERERDRNRDIERNSHIERRNTRKSLKNPFLLIKMKFTRDKFYFRHLKKKNMFLVRNINFF